ncbi:hypothetical protein QAD02_010897 [Eretmocerus hayati]|uniref:Uncharacterized protein n=1 Tax=Eretmocerus hayati TaxID=131215 RepID=A0ACC2NVD5_9HYME|nr:hypothetical protein QAD02_010897 [Eretmocerus hayati]
MRKWQILEFDGHPYYAFVPEDESPIKEEAIPELNDWDELHIQPDSTLDEDDDYELTDYHDEEMSQELKCPTRFNGVEIQSKKSDDAVGELYHVELESGSIRLGKLNMVSRQLSTGSDEESRDFLGFNAAGDENETVGQVHHEPKEPDSNASGDESFAGKKILKCKLCSETFDSRIAFRKHVAWTHKRKVCILEDGVYICSVCDYRSTKKQAFAAHLQRKHETRSRKRPKQHQKPQSASDGQSGEFPCEVCSFVCRSKHSLQAHFVRKHTDRYEHECSFCPKKFKVKGDLTNHVRFHHKEKPVKCNVCGKTCLNSGSLYVHQKWAHFKPEFECPVCHRRMVTQENLEQHMLAQHEKREKIVCAECGKTFTKKDSFKRHMMVHSGARPFACFMCNKAFARKSQLRQHILIHTGKRPFVCDICGKSFTQKPGLICHRKTHPGPHPPLPVMRIEDIVREFTESVLKERAAAAADGSEERAMHEKQVVEMIELLEADDDEDGEEEEEDVEFEEVEGVVEYEIGATGHDEEAFLEDKVFAEAHEIVDD